MSSRANKRGRSTTRSSRGARAVSRSASSRSMSRTTGVARTWPMKMTWGSKAFDPFPTKLNNVVFRYSANISITPAAASVPGSHVFRTNSLFDPDYTGVGSQPYGFDQYANIYKYYRVNKAVITVTYQGGAMGANTTMGTTIRTTPTVVTDSEHIREVKGTRCTNLLGGFAGEQKVQQVWTREDVNVENFDSMTSVFTGNPNEQNYFHVWLAPNSVAPLGAGYLAVDIIYYAELWSPLLQSKS